MTRLHHNMYFKYSTQMLVLLLLKRVDYRMTNLLQNCLFHQIQPVLKVRVNLYSTGYNIVVNQTLSFKVVINTPLNSVSLNN